MIGRSTEKYTSVPTTSPRRQETNIPNWNAFKTAVIFGTNGATCKLPAALFGDWDNRKKTGRDVCPTLLARKRASLLNYNLLHRT
jgi:hypothetical protein